jgi:hypothetical protein
MRICSIITPRVFYASFISEDCCAASLAENIWQAPRSHYAAMPVTIVTGSTCLPSDVPLGDGIPFHLENRGVLVASGR